MYNDLSWNESVRVCGVKSRFELTDYVDGHNDDSGLVKSYHLLLKAEEELTKFVDEVWLYLVHLLLYLIVGK